ncbi:hypothetical protein R1sor_014836 [Riccia sorocarpa]|uniref:Uncharacterized protein n=1 Tax=Riccia sorocarpa TaxID=122646 RepID=A0ABD3HDH5_9MARC
MDSGTGLDQVIQLGSSTYGGQGKMWIIIKRRIKTMRMRTLNEMKGRPIKRLMAADRLGFLPDNTRGGAGPLSMAVGFMSRMVEDSSTNGKKISDPSIWKWDDRECNRSGVSWKRMNLEWRLTLKEKSTLRVKYNASWGLNWDTGKWEELWKSFFLEISYGFGVFVWRDRCREVFERGSDITPVKVILQETGKLVEGLSKKYRSDEVSKMLEDNVKKIALMGALNQYSATVDHPVRHQVENRHFYVPQTAVNANEDDTRRMSRRNALEGNRTRGL